jgi:hypothetical protein
MVAESRAWALRLHSLYMTLLSREAMDVDKRHRPRYDFSYQLHAW